MLCLIEVWVTMKKLRLDQTFLPSTVQVLPLVFLQFLGLEAHAQIRAEISEVGDATHIEFLGASDWNYEVNAEGNKIVLSVPQVETASLLQIKDWSDSRVTKVETSDGVDQKTKITLHLSGNDIESFDYLTDEPSRLIVDVYKGEAKQAAAKESEPKKKGSDASSKKSSNSEKVQDRKPAGTEFISGPPKYSGPMAAPENLDEPEKELNDFGIFDGTDPTFERFTIKKEDIDPSAVIASRRNIYITFPMLELEDGNLEKLWNAPPKYEIIPEDDRENKLIRFLNKLFEDNKFATFFETLEKFRQEYPQSERYDELLSYMEADAYYKLWLKDKVPADFEAAATKYNKILITYPQSRLGERIALLLGYSYIYRKNSFGAVRSFEKYLRKYPNSPFRHSAKITISRAYSFLRKYDKALEILDEVEKDESAGSLRAEAAYRKGDIHFRKKDFSAATKAYEAAQDKFPLDWKRFPMR